MCGSANRKGFLCSECIDGFGPSATSLKFKCSNCTAMSAGYRVILYLLSELIPMSIFYFIVLIFQINLTSAPMVSFILTSQLALKYITEDVNHMIASMLSVFYGIWTLDFFRHALPPFCITKELNIVHSYHLSAVYLYSLSIVFIVMTWISIELYSRNVRIVVWMWRALETLFVKLFTINNILVFRVLIL